MKLSPVKLKTNDFEEKDKEFVEALGGILNPFIDNIVRGFNKNFSVDDNLPFEFRTIDVTVDINGNPISVTSFTTNLVNIKGYVCINVIDIQNTQIYPTGTPFISFEISGTTVKIKNIASLPSGATYRLVLLGISQ